MTAKLRGRAGQPLRPGLITKAVLSGEIPLRTNAADPGKLVVEASITDIHSTYKLLTNEENIVRPRDRKLRGMTYRSFVTMFHFAYLLSLVERVREEPMLFPPARGILLSIRKIDDVPQIVEAKRVIYKLTGIGIEDELAWTNLCKAWIEHWPVPQKVTEGLPPISVTHPVMAPPVEEEPTIAAITVKPKRPKLSETPSVTQFRKLLVYLRDLRDSGISAKEMHNELYDMSGATSDWAVWIEDSLETAANVKQKTKVVKFTKWNEHIKEATEGFLDDDITKIISSLEKLT